MLDIRGGELRKHGIRIRLRDQSLQILLMLLDRPGEVVLRSDIRLKLWPEQTLVEFDQSINSAVRGLRAALSDSAESPLYIETLPKRGYRFLGQVERIAELEAEPDGPVAKFEHGFNGVVKMPVGGEAIWREEPRAIMTLAPAPAPGGKWRLAAAGALLVLAVAAGAWFVWPASSGPPQRVIPVTTYPGSELQPSFSPDGRQIAFSWDGEKDGNRDIYVKLLGEATCLRLTTDSADDVYPAWAPDGRRIAFRRKGTDGGIYTVSVLGGSEQKLSDLATDNQMSWSPDGKWLAVASIGQERIIFLLPAGGGEPRRIPSPILRVPDTAARASPEGDAAVSFSPVGRQLAYLQCTGTLSCDVYVTDLSPAYLPQGRARRITTQSMPMLSLAWDREGKSLIYSGSPFSRATPYLWRARADGRGTPQRLDIAGPFADAPSVAPVGARLVFQRFLRDIDIWRYRTNGAMEPLIVSTLTDQHPQFSPDGTRIAFISNRGGEAMEIWVALADGSKPVEMTHNLGHHQSGPRWSPDGRSIAFSSQGQDGHWDVYVMDAAGGGPRRLTPEPSDEREASWSRDGKWIYFSSDRTGRREIWRMPPAGGAEQQLTQGGGHDALESADGTTLFYASNTGNTLMARPASGGPERHVLDDIVSWAYGPVEDGIYYLGGYRSFLGVPGGKQQAKLKFFRFSTGTSQTLTTIDGAAGLGLSVSPDRSTILFTKSATSGADLMMIENFR